MANTTLGKETTISTKMIGATIRTVKVVGTTIFHTDTIEGVLVTSMAECKKAFKARRNPILLRVMTEPSDVPLMKLCSAVLTVNGGVSCHAAIVCNIYGIPCVTGIGGSLSSYDFGQIKNTYYWQQTKLIPLKTKISVTGSEVTFEIPVEIK
jgi:phosphoenolpyruvate synthase/pyruvate phosphate dikinase